MLAVLLLQKVQNYACFSKIIMPKIMPAQSISAYFRLPELCYNSWQATIQSPNCPITNTSEHDLNIFLACPCPSITLHTQRNIFFFIYIYNFMTYKKINYFLAFRCSACIADLGSRNQIIARITQAKTHHRSKKQRSKFYL